MPQARWNVDSNTKTIAYMGIWKSYAL